MVLYRTYFVLCMYFFKNCGGGFLGCAHLKQAWRRWWQSWQKKERVSGVVDCAVGGNYFSINFGLPLRGRGEGGEGRVRTLTPKCLFKNSKIECRWPLRVTLRSFLPVGLVYHINYVALQTRYVNNIITNTYIQSLNWYLVLGVSPKNRGVQI